MTQDSPAPVVCDLHSPYSDFSIRQIPSFCKHTGIFPQKGFLKKAPRVSQHFLRVPSTAGVRRPVGRWCWIPCDVRWTVGEAPPGPWEHRPSAAGERDQTLVPTLTSDRASKGPPSLTSPMVVSTPAFEDRAHSPHLGGSPSPIHVPWGAQGVREFRGVRGRLSSPVKLTCTACGH